jgi:hypothetical protein
MCNESSSSWLRHRAKGEATLIPGGFFPDDLDTTSLALMVLPPKNSEVATSILEKMSRYVNPDGSVLVGSPSRFSGPSLTSYDRYTLTEKKFEQTQ